MLKILLFNISKLFEPAQTAGSIFMKVTAVIAEYNLFHNGHIRQLEYIREHDGDDTLRLVIMSGKMSSMNNTYLSKHLSLQEAMVLLPSTSDIRIMEK